MVYLLIYKLNKIKVLVTMVVIIISIVSNLKSDQPFLRNEAMYKFSVFQKLVLDFSNLKIPCLEFFS